MKGWGAPIDVSRQAACGLMPGAKHFVDYPCSTQAGPCYGHGGSPTDTNVNWDANECYSDNNGGTWYCVYNSEHSIFTMHYAMLYSTW